MASFWKGVGEFLGGAAGTIVGTIDGIKDGIEKLQDGGSLKEAGEAFVEKFEETFEQTVEEGAEFGENELPEIAEKTGKAAAWLIGTAVTAMAMNKAGEELGKKLGNNPQPNTRRKLLAWEDVPQSMSEKIGKKFTKKVMNRKQFL